VSGLGFLGLGLNSTPAQPAIHSLLVNYTNTGTCLHCHGQGGLIPGENRATEVMKGAHWTWTATNQPAGHGAQVMGKKNIINNYCIATPSNEPRCTSCHIGISWRDNTFNFNNVTNIDCLVCHDTTGTYKKTPTGAGVPDPTVNLANVAMHVGQDEPADLRRVPFLWRRR
jgi:hypothetical protein